MKLTLITIGLWAAIILVFIMLTGCSYGKLSVTDANGVSATASVNSLWSDVKLSGLTVKVHTDGTREFTVDSLDDNRTNGLESFNKMLPGLVGSAIEGAVKGAGLAAGKP